MVEVVKGGAGFFVLTAFLTDLTVNSLPSTAETIFIVSSSECSSMRPSAFP